MMIAVSRTHSPICSLDIGKDEYESPEPPPLPPSSGLRGGGGIVIRLSSVNTGIKKAISECGFRMSDLGNQLQFYVFPTSAIRNPPSDIPLSVSPLPQRV